MATRGTRSASRGSPSRSRSLCGGSGDEHDPLPTDVRATDALSVALGPASLPEGAGRIRQHPESVRRGALVETFDPEVRTLCDAFRAAVRKHGPRPFLGWRPVDRRGDAPVAGPYRWLTFAEVGARVERLAAGLALLGVARQANVGLYGPNCPAWYIGEYAVHFCAGVTVPLYDTLGEASVAFICGQTEMGIVFAAADRAKVLLRLKGAEETSAQLSSLRTIVLIDEPGAETQREIDAAASKHGVSIVPFAQLEEDGAKEEAKQKLKAVDPVRADELFTLCYTSGTTGAPKGVMLPHRAIIAEAGAAFVLSSPDAVPPGGRLLFRVHPGVVHISYLPLAHVYERVVLTLLGAGGASVGFWRGSPDGLLDDVAALRPTVFVTVPRLLSRIRDRVLASVESGPAWKRWLFRTAYAAKESALRSTGATTHWLWDRLVFGAVRARLGGRVAAVLTGSAPVAPAVMEFVRIVFSCDVYEGYGQSETMAGSTLTVRGDWSTGHVGVPMPCCELVLASIPEMGYSALEDGAAGPSSDGLTVQPRRESGSSGPGGVIPTGEICIRGPSCFVGYYREPELTSQALTSDGWVRTGDVGQWDGRGRLRIVDRKKNIFKLAQGEYVSPERVENVLARSRFVAQAFVDGASTCAAPVAVLVPDFDALRPWAAEKLGAAAADMTDAALAALPEVRALLLAECASFGSRRGGTGDLKGFEVPRAVTVEPAPFSADNGLLTVTFKLRRHEAKRQYAAAIAAMCADVDAISAQQH